MEKQRKWIWFAVWGIIVLVGGGGTLFSWMPRTPGMFYGGCAMLIFSAVAGMFLLRLSRGKTVKQSLISGLVFGAVYAAVMAAVVYLCDQVVFKDRIAEYQPVHSSLIIVLLDFVLIILLCVLIPKKADPKLIWLKRSIGLILCGVALMLSGLPQNWWWGRYNYTVKASKWLTAPTGFSSYTEPEKTLIDNADFYVSVRGSDENDGSFAHPFATLDRAREAVRSVDKSGKSGITVAVMAGEYRTEKLVFTEEDSGTESCPVIYCAYGDGAVILNAGLTLDPTDFEAVSGAQAERLRKAAREHVVWIDLGKYGVTAEDYGNLHAIGSYNTAWKYDGDYSGDANCELFVDDVRQVLARYPNEGWLKTGMVLEHGEPGESNDNPHVKVEGWEELRNPRGETYALDQKLADRINSWEDLDNVWMFGYFTADWAASSTPIGHFDYESRTMQNKFVARFDTTDLPANYYFYNVLEELDAEGEWYLDRKEGVLYLYRTEGFESARIMLSLSKEPIIRIMQADYLIFRGFTLEGTRGDAIQITGDSNTVEACLIRNIAGSGIIAEGYSNLIAGNEITGVQKSAVRISGGDTASLTPGNNRVYNNYIHNWTGGNGASGIRVFGVGQWIDHNELHHTTDSAIEYDGNDHIIEYNLIHDVCLESSDGGAIYSGRSWTDYGCIVRYNGIYNMGTPRFSAPNGIYLDDGLAGQTICGNLLVNVPQDGIKLGGGRDCEIWGNVIVNTTQNGIHGIRAVYYSSTTANIWDSLKPGWDVYKDNPIWQKAYPELARTFWDENRTDDPYFIANAANNKVNGNVVVNIDGKLGEVEDDNARFSDFTGNAVFTLDQLKEIFEDPENGNYHIRKDSPIYDIIPGFSDIPIGKMGRE
ncbi:MAG: right-handed parallel beta-helix repeat-containing protein [Lachnospiraceae bacterium]|nr:right-handed parallel beta-helix repeat-containing protein [Lachnospiraceae bacterium]